MFFQKKAGRDGAGVYDDRQDREKSIAEHLKNARRARAEMDRYWNKMRAYYDGTHASLRETALFLDEMHLPWQPAVSTDGFIQVESQIERELPDFSFSGRDVIWDEDREKARQREHIVRYVLDRNDMEFKNIRNERRLNLYGTAIWKVSYSEGERAGGDSGDIVIENPSPAQIFPDPTASDVDGCEYIACVYRMNRQRALRLFDRDLKAAGLSPDDLFQQDRTPRRTDSDSLSRMLFDCGYELYDENTDTVEVVEWWFRQPQDGSFALSYDSGEGRTEESVIQYRAGDIALSVLIGGREVRYLPKFWSRTDCSMFPFVIYNKTPREDSVFGKSELEPIIPLIDATDRQLAFAQLNAAFSASDVILAEENAFADADMPDCSPGAVWKLRPGMIDCVRRLGNLSSESAAHYDIADRYRALIRETTGNYDFLQNDDLSQMKTATGLALLSERAERRTLTKNADKYAAFARLLRLVDYMALENFSYSKIVQIGAAPDTSMVYGFGDIAEMGYVPQLDVRVLTGGSASSLRSYALSVLSDLLSADISETNYLFVKSIAELSDLPMRKEICDLLDAKFAPKKL